MQVETMFLRLFREVAIGDRIDDWRLLDWRVGQMPGCFRGDGRETQPAMVFQREAQIFTLPSAAVASPDWNRQRFRIGNPSRSKKCCALRQVGDADVVSGAHCDVNAVEIERTSIGVQQGVCCFFSFKALPCCVIVA